MQKTLTKTDLSRAVDKFKEKIDDTADDEIAILYGGFANYYRIGMEEYDWLADQLGHEPYINDYQDLCVDPHGLTS